jgi:hypothetical protein
MEPLTIEPFILVNLISLLFSKTVFFYRDDASRRMPLSGPCPIRKIIKDIGKAARCGKCSFSITVIMKLRIKKKQTRRSVLAASGLFLEGKNAVHRAARSPFFRVLFLKND